VPALWHRCGRLPVPQPHPPRSLRALHPGAGCTQCRQGWRGAGAPHLRAHTGGWHPLAVRMQGHHCCLHAWGWLLGRRFPEPVPLAWRCRADSGWSVSLASLHIASLWSNPQDDDIPGIVRYHTYEVLQKEVNNPRVRCAAAQQPWLAGTARGRYCTPNCGVVTAQHHIGQL
jgi:hypothetical protein